MCKADLHVHSSYSKHPSEWFLQRIGTRESYTDVDTAYRLAKSRGMDFVTLTDHNTIDGALLLKENYPEDTFISMEATTYFPEDGCKIHVLVYDIDERQAREINEQRNDIYRLRDYLKTNDIVHSVAHATYSVNDRLTVEHLEKLVLLFDVFEAINGGRHGASNRAWAGFLKAITPKVISTLYSKHRIEPFGDTPWIKGVTGGSDDHAGLYIGKTYTEHDGSSLRDFLNAVAKGTSRAGGMHSDHNSFVMAIYKVAYEFSKDRGSHTNGGFWNLINSALFGERTSGFKSWLTRQRIRKNADNTSFLRFYESLTSSRFRGDDENGGDNVDRLCGELSRLADDYFGMILQSLERDLKQGETGRLIKSISAAFPALFLSAPFFSTIKYQSKNRDLVADLYKSVDIAETPREKKVLWLSDTVAELNGVAVTMRNMAWVAHRSERAMKLVTTLPEDEFQKLDLPPNVINIPCIYDLTPDFYSAFTLRAPSVLGGLDLIAREYPDELIISTPGPVGVLGLIMGKLMGIRCTGVYHTDLTKQSQLFIGDPWVANVIEGYTRWFYSNMDELRVPTNRYMRMLSGRGLEIKRMRLFRRGIDPGFVVDDPEKRNHIRKQLGLKDGTTLMFSGRLGKEKNLDMLKRVYDRIAELRGSVNLLVAGDGPEYDDLVAWADNRPRIFLPGRLDRSELSHYYTLSDVFVFPSTTDTFGMVVLEAQACGLPAVVSDEGGPQEIVRDGKTGYVVAADHLDGWVEKILELIDLKESRAHEYERMRKAISRLFGARHGWEHILAELIGPKPTESQREMIDIPREHRTPALV